MAQNINVVVRVRPMSAREVEEGEAPAVLIPVDTTKVVELAGRRFKYDRVFGSLSKQVDLFSEVAEPLIPQVLAGYGCTVFAYGQTGSGKTWTMEGSHPATQDILWNLENEEMGMTPRSFHHLFNALKDVVDCMIRVSFIEIYEEKVYDLLSPIKDYTKLGVFGDGPVTISGLTEIVVVNSSQVYNLLARGSRKRRTAFTLMNSRSSRSHSIFTISVHTTEKLDDGQVRTKIGKLNLVDLAGSENIGDSGAVNAQARVAGVNNKSLLTLGRVIDALNETPLPERIPYRDSVLTRILADSLGGRTKTSIIATISPAAVHVEETLNTLRYVKKAMKITNRPKVNQIVSKEIPTKETEQNLRGQLAASLEREHALRETEQQLRAELAASLEREDGLMKEKQEKQNQINALRESNQFLDQQAELSGCRERELAVMRENEELTKQNKALRDANRNSRAEIARINEEHEKAIKALKSRKNMIPRPEFVALRSRAQSQEEALLAVQNSEYRMQQKLVATLKREKKLAKQLEALKAETDQNNNTYLSVPNLVPQNAALLQVPQFPLMQTPRTMAHSKLNKDKENQGIETIPREEFVVARGRAKTHAGDTALQNITLATNVITVESSSPRKRSQSDRIPQSEEQKARDLAASRKLELELMTQNAIGKRPSHIVWDNIKRIWFCLNCPKEVKKRPNAHPFCWKRNKCPGYIEKENPEDAIRGCSYNHMEGQTILINLKTLLDHTSRCEDALRYRDEYYEKYKVDIGRPLDPLYLKDCASKPPSHRLAP